jgi:hypothetical protein
LKQENPQDKSQRNSLVKPGKFHKHLETTGINHNSSKLEESRNPENEQKIPRNQEGNRNPKIKQKNPKNREREG